MLDPESGYEVQVCASTEKGCGPKSEPYTGYTDYPGTLSSISLIKGKKFECIKFCYLHIKK